MRKTRSEMIIGHHKVIQLHQSIINDTDILMADDNQIEL